MIVNTLPAQTVLVLMTVAEFSFSKDLLMIEVLSLRLTALGLAGAGSDSELV